MSDHLPPQAHYAVRRHALLPIATALPSPGRELDDLQSGHHQPLPESMGGRRERVGEFVDFCHLQEEFFRHNPVGRREGDKLKAIKKLINRHEGSD